MSESQWMERAQSAEARLAALESNFRPALERVKMFKANFGVREHEDGAISIDFDKFVENLGEESCMELKSIIEETYKTLHLKHG